MLNGNPLPFALATGEHGSYQWLSTSKHNIDDLLAACPAILLGKYVAVTSFDSGPLTVTDAQKSSGWHHRGGITYSPRIESLEMVPTHELYDEWYVFGVPFDLGDIREGNIFEHSLSAGHVEVFVNFFGFALDAPEVQELVSRFWQQLEWIQPESYISQSDYGFMSFVTRNPESFAAVRQTFGARS